MIVRDILSYYRRIKLVKGRPMPSTRLFSVTARGLCLRLVSFGGQGIALCIALPVAPGLAADECGAGPIVTCTLADNPYAEGISYLGDLSKLTFDKGVMVTTPSLGLSVSSGDRSVILDTTAGSVTTTGDGRSHGIAASSSAGGIVINAGSLSTVGFGAAGVDAISASGDIAVQAGNIVTQGDQGYGIAASSRSGAVDVTARGRIKTAGDMAVGIGASTRSTGAVSVSLDQQATVETFGWRSPAIRARSSDGAITVETHGLNRSHGENADAINAATDDGAITIIAGGTIEALGAGSSGLRAMASGTGPISIIVPDRAQIVGGTDSDSIGSGILAGAAVSLTSIDIGAGALVTAKSGRAIAAQGDDEQDFDAHSFSIANRGAVRGYMELSNFADRFENQAGGLFNPWGVSDFRDGADVFANYSGGVVQVGQIGALGPQTVNLSNLETFFNAGVVTLQNRVPGDRLIVTAAGRSIYVSNGGALHLDTVLNQGGANALSDLLVVDRTEVGSGGATQVFIANAGGLGAQTDGNGIQVVEVSDKTLGASANNAFSLAERVVAGAYEYALHYGGIATDAQDGNWYLRSDYRTEVPLYTAMPPLAMQYGFATIDTLHERVGETYPRPAESNAEERTIRCSQVPANSRCTAGVPVKNGEANSSSNFAGAWGRVLGEIGRHDRDNFLRAGPGYDYRIGGLQTGLDLFGRANADGSEDRAGFYVAIGHANADVQAVPDGKAGSISMDAYTLGGYWTHYGSEGWYLDGVAQGTWYESTATTLTGASFDTDGFGVAASLEGGYPIHLGNDLTLEPQAQLVYQHMGLDEGRDPYGLVKFNDADALRGRIGIRLTETWNTGESGRAQPITAWLRTNLWHEFIGDTQTTFSTRGGQNPVTFSSPHAGTWGEIGGGVTGQIAETVSLFATTAYSHSLDGRGQQAWNGKVGLTVVW